MHSDLSSTPVVSVMVALYSLISYPSIAVTSLVILLYILSQNKYTHIHMHTCTSTHMHTHTHAPPHNYISEKAVKLELKEVEQGTED